MRPSGGSGVCEILVDEDLTCVHISGKGHRARNVARVDAGAKSELGAVGDGDRLFGRIHDLHGQDGAEDLFLHHARVFRRIVDDRGVAGFLEDALDDGVLLAPGESCGAAYAGWARLCFTSAPPDQVELAVARLSRRLGYT